MKPRLRRLVPWAALIVAGAWVASTLIPRAAQVPFRLDELGRIPVLADGRIKPLDTVARTSLLLLQDRQRLMAGEREIPPMQWLLEVFYRPDVADGYSTFRIDNADLLSIFNLTPADGQGGVRFSYRQLEPGLAELERQDRMAEPVDASARTAFQQAVVSLEERVDAYSRLKYAVEPPGVENLFALVTAPQFAEQAASVFGAMDTYSPLRVVPPGIGAAADGWSTAGHGFAQVAASGQFDPALMLYARIGAAWRRGDPVTFNLAVDTLASQLSGREPAAVMRSRWEARFNEVQPFYTSLVLYVAAFFLAALSWLTRPQLLGRYALHLMGLAFGLASVGIVARMWLEGRPPVTNLYSSALFIGWGAAGLCLILERLNRNGVASAAGSLIGFGTLVIAHHLSLSGDTMEMMRAVLDSNFWLSTHVVTVTAGYSATFLAGFLAAIYLLRAVLTRSFDEETGRSLERMVYGIVCFATFFSFVGTVLGGIWADQSWGRFWGWDPKENGALLIVIWNAVILHARWAGLARARGLMALAVFGNIVTAWSWFGTNMLGVGLHSYGFTDAAFKGLVAFVGSQLAIIALAAVPRQAWRSFARPTA